MPKYNEKAFLSMYHGVMKASGKTPDLCICPTDLVARDVLDTLYKHGISMNVIADDAIHGLWIGCEADLGLLPLGGKN